MLLITLIFFYFCHSYGLILIMEYRNIYFVLLSVFMLFSCSERSIETVKDGSITVGFSVTEPLTKPIISQDGLSSVWCEGDRLALWAVNPSGNFILNNVQFSVYGFSDFSALFTATLSQEMPEERYTYYGCSPLPVSAEGTDVVFNIPEVQDGRLSGGADIIVCSPTPGGPLRSIEDGNNGTALNLYMNHLLHQFRFFVPEGSSLGTDSIQRVEILFPYNVTGNYSLDVTAPDTPGILSEGGNSIVLELTDALTVSEGDSYNYACAGLFPSTRDFTSSDSLFVTAYTAEKMFKAEPISVEGRFFAAGHSTPVRLSLSESVISAKVTLYVGSNYIGEALTDVYIKEGEELLLSYSHNDSEFYENFQFDCEYTGSEQVAQFDRICDAVSGGRATVVFETANTVSVLPIPASALSLSGKMAAISLGDVPYLLYEDFSGAASYSKDDDYTTGNERNWTGYLLDGYMADNGWNAARFALYEGVNIRLNSRYQSGAWVVERLSGRLDTPAMSRIKEGSSVNVVFEYDYSIVVPAGLNVDDSRNKMAFYILGTHTSSQDSPIDGVYVGDMASSCSVVYESERHSSGNAAQMTHKVHDVNGCTSATRFVFMMGTDRNTKHIASNSQYYLYLDNIKIYIH